ncbi:GrpB family protein [Streptomyces sp. XM4193]|uniref:GrpB family protein n=1 Tax=Streptomyces sp. XM4193 TaxID=2929782 RepID=UPI001FFA9771|nr:GrpB family protein [Streptomyces sp. XM4193]MCK1794783.1 GrpB family protein [Streptomyces sp. XM4193]
MTEPGGPAGPGGGAGSGAAVDPAGAAQGGARSGAGSEPAGAAREAEMNAAHVSGRAPRLDGAILLAEPDPEWPRAYEREAARVRAALPRGVRLLLEHVGSTSVPGLVAKPVLDILLAVPDAARETQYVPPLERAGYALLIREPQWHEHRLLRPADGPSDDRRGDGRRGDGRRTVNLHVFGAGSSEVRRMLLFRDTLRAVPAERELYAATKRELAARDWEFTQHYADAKNEVVDAILARAGWRGGRTRPD